MGTQEEQKVSHPDISEITARDVKELAERLEKDDYDTAFDSLRDWHLLRAVAFHRSELAEPYIYLLDLERFDEC